MTLQDTIDKLQALKGLWPEIAKRANVPYGTLRKVAEGTTKNPGVQTLDKINKACKLVRVK